MSLPLPLLAGGGWEGVNPCGKVQGKYSPHPTSSCLQEEKRKNVPLQAGEGVVIGEMEMFSE